MAFYDVSVLLDRYLYNYCYILHSKYFSGIYFFQRGEKMKNILLMLTVLMMTNVKANNCDISQKLRTTKLAQFTNNFQDDTIYYLNVLTDCDNQIKYFHSQVFKEDKLLPGRDKLYDIQSVKQGILNKTLGFIVMSYEIGSFNGKDGGSFAINYAYSLLETKISGKGYHTINMNISLEQDKWVLLDDTFNLTNDIYFPVRKNFFKFPLGLDDPEFRYL